MKVRLQRACLILTTLIFLPWVLAQPQASATAVLRGTVTDPSGAVIAGTLIRIVSWHRNAGGKAPESDMAVYTDISGQFKCEVTPGIYDVFVSDPGFSPEARQVNVESGNETVFNPKLKLSRFIKLLP